MKKLGPNIEYFLSELSGDQEQARINLRAHQVRNRYKSVMQTVYRDTAQLFLQHTNNVYIMNKDQVKTLIVYVDESIFAAELNAQRELIKLKLLEQFGEEVEEFKIYVSRGKYKLNHPYILEEQESTSNKYVPIPLDEHEQTYVYQTVSSISNQPLKASFEKAMTAAIALQKAEKGKTS